MTLLIDQQEAGLGIDQQAEYEEETTTIDSFNTRDSIMSAALCETKQSARLDLKTNQYLKSQLEEAAGLSGVNLTAFILNAASEKAREVMMFHAQTTLSATACRTLNEILKNPPQEATPALKAMMQRRRTKSGQTI